MATLRDQRVPSLSYFDVSSLCGVVGAVLVRFVRIMRRSFAEKGVHIGTK